MDFNWKPVQFLLQVIALQILALGFALSVLASLW